MNKVLGKLGVILALCIPLLIGLGLVLIAVVLQLEISLIGIVVGFPFLGLFSLMTFLKYKKEVKEALRS